MAAAIPDWFPSLLPMMRDAWGWVGILLFVALMYAHYGLTLLHLSTLAIDKARRSSRARRVPSDLVTLTPPPPPPLTVGYLVAVYNDDLTVASTIESILAQTRRPDQIVVVDDGSTDGTAAILDGFRSRGVEVLHLPRNGGKNAALAAGIELLRTDLVAITDADCIVDPKYVEHILEGFRDPEVAAVTGVGESIPENALTAARQVEWSIFYHMAQRAQAKRNAILVLVGNVTTYRRDVLLRVGFDHPTISEDLSATFRLHLMGAKMGMAEKAVVHAADPPTFRALSRQLTRWYTDFWIVVKSYTNATRKRKGYFARVEYPHVALHMTSVSLLHVVLPVVVLFVAPKMLLGFYLVALALDTLIIGLVALLKPRRDLWKAIGTRWLVRTTAAFIFLACMVRVLTNTHGMRWKKIERRATSLTLGASRRPLRV